jgi:hypothetical protein
MATFAGVPLLTALKWGKDLKSKGWIQTIIAGVPMLERLPHLRVAGRVWEQEMEGTLPNVGFRNVNETYTASSGENESTWWGTTILGGELRVDIAVLNSGVVDDAAKFRSDQYAKHAKAAGMRYSWESFNGTGAASTKGFKGLFQLCADGAGTVYDPGSDAALNFDKLDEALVLMENNEADMLLMNKEIALRFSQKARSFTSMPLIDIGTDALGRPVKRYNGIPFGIVRRGRNASNVTAQILPFTENGLTSLTGGATSSIYAVHYGSDGLTGLLGNSGSMVMRNLQESTEGPYEIGRLEFYPGIAVLDPTSVVRMARITNA